MTQLGLEVDDVTVRFGGLVAVNGVTLAAPRGRITALIGPNGAGKTTLFNVCSGQQRPTDGHVIFDGHDVSRLLPAYRALRGMGRTFQRVQLFDSLSVAQNIASGCEGGLAGANVIRQLVPRRGERAQVQRAVDEVIELCGIGSLLEQRAADLSTGQRRLVELARCLAGRFTLLLLDEPSSGLDHAETSRFGEILCRVVKERGAGIFLVEHDMELVMSISEHIYVLDFGRLLCAGSPDEVRSSEEVRAAYLGVNA